MYIFNRLAGHSEKSLTKKYRRTPPVTLARTFYQRPTTDELLESMKNSISFVVGRNPFERLVSGYRDKILLALRGSHHEKVGRSIVLKYRGVDVKRLGRVGLKMKPTFTEFVRYIVDDYKAGIDLDMHWTPVFTFCNPCQVRGVKLQNILFHLTLFFLIRHFQFNFKVSKLCFSFSGQFHSHRQVRDVRPRPEAHHPEIRHRQFGDVASRKRRKRRKKVGRPGNERLFLTVVT